MIDSDPFKCVYYRRTMSDQKSEFERAAAEQPRGGFISELWTFMKENKKWWLLPIIIVLLLLTMVVILTTTAAGPFIYTLF